MKLLVCIDTSPLTASVAAEAGRLARWMGADIELVHVVRSQSLPDVDRPVPPEDMEYRTSHVEDVAARLRKDGAKVDTRVHVTGRTVPAFIVDEARRLDAALIVIGSHNRGKAFELFVGSVTQGVIAAATVPVVVVNGLSGEGGPG